MFSYEILEDDGVIVLTPSGQITLESFRTVMPQLFADVRSKRIRRILLDYRKLQGWKSSEAKSISFYAWNEGRSLFERIALVFHDGVRLEAEELQELFRNADKDVRLFQPEQYEAALDWLKGD